MPHAEPRLNDVRCRLAFTAAQPSLLALAVAVSDCAGHRVTEQLSVVDADGQPLEVEERAAALGGRIHLVRSGEGPFTVDYSASVALRDDGCSGPEGIDESVIVALRQSRYCPSDALEGFASASFARRDTRGELVRDVAEFVHSRIRYEPGSTGPLHGAIDTLIESHGVCRDFAHLTVALCRAMGIPARMTSVYAPGLSPMDFHAVAEVLTEPGWEVLDATRLAPRQSLVRIATGRDAADTAFATTVTGDVALDTAEITAVTRGELPLDDHLSTVALA